MHLNLHSIFTFLSLTRDILVAGEVSGQIVIDHQVAVVQPGQHTHRNHQLVRTEVEATRESSLERAEGLVIG